MKMKRALSLLLAAVLCLSLAACGGGNDPTPGTTGTEPNNLTTTPSSLPPSR